MSLARQPAMAKKRPPPRTSKTFQAKLRRLIEAKRPDALDKDIASDAGMTKAHFSDLMNSTRPDIRLSTLRSILKAIGATLCEFDRA
jgi:transcriptional regulator with XRE-family HTH domain